MKISQKQAGLLATEIINQLKKQKTHRVSESTKAKLQEFKEKRGELLHAKDAAAEVLNRHDQSLRVITGKLTRSGAYSSIKEIVEDIENAAIPKHSEVEDKIILQSMFTNPEDLEAFVQKIVKEYSKKKPVATS